MKIAILTPSRGRPKELYRFFESINSTVSSHHKIHFMFGIDSDDDTKHDYYNQLLQMQLRAKDSVIVTMIEDEKRPISKIWNELSRIKQWNDCPDVFIMGNDDLEYLTHNWDLWLEEEIIKADHPFYCYWFDDGINGERHCAFPIVTKHWVGSIGYFVPEIFQFFYHDTWVFDIASKIDCLKYLPGIKTRHLHFTQGSSPYDKTYSQWRQGTIHADDTTLFNLKNEDRALTGRFLQQRIDAWINLKKAAEA